MAIRLVITDAVWAELEHILRPLKRYPGSPPQFSDRMFIHDPPPWKTVYDYSRVWHVRRL
jgi:hypothetical protein